jgi:protein-S-isoprenylcysteine O-methyltransferase Ste14
MTHISIALDEPAFTTLLAYYWRELPTREYALVFAGLFALQGLAEIMGLAARLHGLARQSAHLLINAVLSAAFLVSGSMAGYTLLLADSPPQATYWAGMAVLIFACIGRDLTRSIVKPPYASYLEMALGEGLVISGIFALIRHPLLALYLLEMTAFALIAWNAVSAAMLVVACAGLFWKIRREEQRLTREFAERFAAYCRRTRRLIPLIY